MRSVTKFVVPLTAVLAAACVGASPAAASDSASISSPTLVARGAAVNFNLTVTCDPYLDYTGAPSTAVEITVVFRQNVHQSQLTTATYDSGYQMLNICDGSPHTLSLQVLPSPNPAIKGSALFNVTETFNSFGGTPAPVTFSDVANIH